MLWIRELSHTILTSDIESKLAEMVSKFNDNLFRFWKSAILPTVKSIPTYNGSPKAK